MRRSGRILAFLLTLSVTLAPAAFGGCLMPCQLAAARSNPSTSPEPACHRALHGTAPSRHAFGDGDAPCRHDRFVASVPDDVASRQQMASAGTAARYAPAAAAVPDVLARDLAALPPARSRPHLISPLRI